MKLVKYNNHYEDPFTSLEKLFNEAFTGSSRYPLFNGLYSNDFERSFAVDIHQDNENYFVTAELPGIKKKDVKLEIENNVLTISGETKSRKAKEEEAVKFSRSITLSENIDTNKVSALMKDGLLTVTLPVREESKPRTISIS